MQENDLSAGIQYTIDQHGHVTAIVVTPEAWERIMMLLEEAEDRALVRALRERLRQHPAASGALHWQDVEQEWA